jgi:hypothetical protein
MLVISNALNDTSSGLVIRNFISNANSKGMKVYGFFEEVSHNNKNGNFFSLGKIRFINKLDKLLLILFNRSFGCKYRARLLFENYIKVEKFNNYPVVVFVTGVNLFSIYSIAEIVNSGLFNSVNVHFLDTIISKNSWGENKFVTRAKQRVIHDELKKIVSKINFSFTNIEASKLIQKTIEIEFRSQILYSYSVQNYLFSFDINPSRNLIFYFRGTLDERRKSDYILDLFNYFSKEFYYFNFVFQGNIKYSKSLSNIDNLTILPFSTDIGWLEKADVFVDIDLFLDDVYIPGKFFEYISYKKPILSITPLNSALRNMFEKDLTAKSALFITDFDKSSILAQLNILSEHFKMKTKVNVNFANVKTLENLIIN